jgi:aryl-alcohol dehydrogenase-like predicted oxidoreductase
MTDRRLGPTGLRVSALSFGSWVGFGGQLDEGRARDCLAAAYEAVDVARQLDCTPAQLAIAWCARDPRVSTVITGASRVEQVHENLAALDVVDRLDDGVLARLDAATR